MKNAHHALHAHRKRTCSTCLDSNTVLFFLDTQYTQSMRAHDNGAWCMPTSMVTHAHACMPLRMVHGACPQAWWHTPIHEFNSCMHLSHSTSTTRTHCRTLSHTHPPVQLLHAPVQQHLHRTQLVLHQRLFHRQYVLLDLVIDRADEVEAGDPGAVRVAALKDFGG
eukprot:1161047-Pelagomonas_calceolata.AAC.14